MLLVTAKGCSNSRVNLCLNEIVIIWGPYPSPASRHCAHFGKPAILTVPLAVQMENWGENRSLLKRNSCISTGLINQKQANIKSEQCPALCVACILLHTNFLIFCENCIKHRSSSASEAAWKSNHMWLLFYLLGASISRLCLELLGDAAEEVQIKVRCLGHFLNRYLF